MSILLLLLLLLLCALVSCRFQLFGNVPSGQNKLLTHLKYLHECADENKIRRFEHFHLACNTFATKLNEFVEISSFSPFLKKNQIQMEARLSKLVPGAEGSWMIHMTYQRNALNILALPKKSSPNVIFTLSELLELYKRGHILDKCDSVEKHVISFFLGNSYLIKEIIFDHVSIQPQLHCKTNVAEVQQDIIFLPAFHRQLLIFISK